MHQVKTVTSQSRHEELTSLLKDLDGSAIVYVMTKKDAEQLAVDVSETLVFGGVALSKTAYYSTKSWGFRCFAVFLAHAQ